MPSVKFVKEKKTIEVEEGANLRKAALQSGIEVYPHIHKYVHCPGIGQCASCRVNIKKGQENLSKPSLWERMRLLVGPITFWSRLGHEEELRLSCQTQVYGDIEVETQPSMNLHGEKFWN